MSHFVSYIDAVRDAILDLDDVRRGWCWWASNRDAHCHLGECYGITRIRNDYFGVAPILVSYSVHHRVVIPTKDKSRRAAFLSLAETFPLFVPCQVTKLRGEVEFRINGSIPVSPDGRAPRALASIIWEEVVRRSVADRQALSKIDSEPF